MAGLTPKQERFASEYLLDLNATQAAIRAGYSAKTANKIGTQLLGKTSIAEAIQEGRQKLSERTEITQDRIMREYALLGFARAGDYIRINRDGDPIIDLSDCTPEQLAALSETQVESYSEHDPESDDPKGTRTVKKVKIKFHDKIGALTNMGRILGIFNDKSTVKHEFSDLADDDLIRETKAALGGVLPARTDAGSAPP